MKLNRFSLKVGLLALAAAAVPALATPGPVWNAASQFNSSTPPADWAYLQRTGAGCVTPGAALASGYAPAAGISGYIVGPIPLVAKNFNTTQTSFSSIKLDPGKMWMHPGTKGECAVVRFKAPSAGTFLVNITMKSVDVASPNMVRGYIFASTAPGTAVGGPELLNSGGAYGSVKSFTRTVSITGSNRFIDFALDDGGNPDPQGAFRFDSTQVDFEVCRIGGPGNGGTNGGDVKRCDRR